MGGEKRNCRKLIDNIEGSPPHGRGKVKLRAGQAEPGGITPAWAGKRSPSPIRTAPSRDHPRMGGEKHAAFAAGLLL